MQCSTKTFSCFCQETDVTAKDSTADENSRSSNTESIWVEGLVPGIDFCNHSKSSKQNSSSMYSNKDRLVGRAFICLFFNKKCLWVYLQGVI